MHHCAPLAIFRVIRQGPFIFEKHFVTLVTGEPIGSCQLHPMLLVQVEVVSSGILIKAHGAV